MRIEANRKGHALEDLDQIIERLRQRLRIAVIFGGNREAEDAVIVPTRNPRSDKTYEAVANDIADSLRRLGFSPVAVLPEDMKLGDALRRYQVNLAWLNSGGTQGYASVCHGPSLLELFGIPYVGHNPLNAAILDNKHIFKFILNGLRIPTPRFLVYNYPNTTGQLYDSEFLRKTFGEESESFIVKPVSGRASQHVYLVESTDLKEFVQTLAEKIGNHILIEAFLPGREFTIGVAGPVVSWRGRLSNLEQPLILSPVERLLGEGEHIFTSMDVKPITPDRIRLLESEGEADMIDALADLSRRIFAGLCLESAVRIDVRLDGNGLPHVLEANPKPDLKYPRGEAINLITAGIAACGMDYDDLILSMLANRIDFLLRYRQSTSKQILSFLS